MIAVGSGRDAEARQALEAWASEGQGDERLAAILALGELREGLGDGDLILVELLQHPDAEVGQCAVLALLRSGDSGWRELVVGVGGDPSHPLQLDAQQLIAQVDDPQGVASPHPALRRLYDLRWDAGRQLGLIDGRPWGTTIIERLGEDDAYLDRVVLSAAGQVHMAGVKDHVLSLLLQEGRAVRVRAAVRVLPRELEQLAQAEIWAPGSAEEWMALMDEALVTGTTPLLPTLLELALSQPDLAPCAAALLAARDLVHAELATTGLEAAGPALRVMVCRGMAESGAQVFLEALAGLAEDPEAEVRAAALVARMQLGERSAYDSARSVLLGDDLDGTQERDELKAALSHAGRSGDLTAFVSGVAGELEEGLERADLLAICILRGRIVDGLELRTAYAEFQPGPRTGRRLLEALGVLPSVEDLSFLANLYPVDGSPEINHILARALIRGGHRKVEPVLRAAVWRGPFDRSVLAAAVVRKSSGMNTLLHWVQKPPAAASSADVRRVGYAIGEWGGVEAISALQERMGGIPGAAQPALQGAYLGAMAARTH